MAAGVVPSANSSILEVLNLYNYEDWSLRVETYLIAEGLWDVVEAPAETPNNGETECREWRMKNAKALHAIQNSCRADVFGFIRGTRSFKDAWETLAKRLKPKNRDIEGMAATLVPSAMINLQPLNKDNYEHWSFWVRKYLLAEDLWDVVQGTSEAPKPEDGEGEAEYMAWRKNNARALHVITIFSGKDAQSCISDSEMAKDAWNTLAEKFNPPQILETPVERGHYLLVRRLILHKKSWCLAITNEHDKTLFQFAAEHRQGDIFDLIHHWSNTAEETKEIISRKDKFGNNMLHVVGKLSPLTQIAHIRGAALQMQYELQWFKKVERMASHKDLNCINSDGLTPREVFTINHRDLVKEGEMSMKETATSSSALVAALIITVMFAAVVTVPGGINGETGIPVYLNTDAFRIFIIADVISLCSSTTSVMVFLGILTSRFAEEDFLTSLPTKLIIGFLSLFLSIGSMMVAFASAVFIMLPGKPSIVISSIVLAGVPIASFLWMQFPFLLEIIISTYGLSFRPMYRRLEDWAWRLKWWARRIYRRFKQFVAPVNQGSNPCFH